MDEELTFEGRQFIDAQSNSDFSLYVLVTDTQTYFSKVSKFFTSQPYNHISLMFEDSFDEIYTFALISPTNGFRGGFKIETVEDLKGAKYSLYRVGVSGDAWKQVKKRVDSLSKLKKETSYSFRSIINFVFKKNLFENVNELRMICSEFVVSVLEEAGIELQKPGRFNIMSPYDIVRHKALEHVRRGTIR
jgi:hypothetical protein